MKNLLLLCCVVSLTTACTATCRQAGQLSVGMTKVDVLKTMEREPDQFSAIKNIQFFYYSCRGKDPDIIIRLVDGKVDAYGKEGDFDLTKDPTHNFNIKLQNSGEPSK